MGDRLRKTTDKHIFGTDPKKRNIAQAVGRDATHAAYHGAKATVEAIKGNKQQAAKDMKRFKDHAKGENVRQRQKSK